MVDFPTPQHNLPPNSNPATIQAHGSNHSNDNMKPSPEDIADQKRSIEADLTQILAQATDLPANLVSDTKRLYFRVWEDYFCQRPPKDNRIEHELVVIRHFLKIAQKPVLGKQLTESEIRVGLAAVILHDTYFFPKITEANIQSAGNNPDEAAFLSHKKIQQRIRHMAGSADNADRILNSEFKSGLNRIEKARCLAWISLHDSWKLNLPWPPATDPLAVALVEADALWPLSPTGPRADVDRDAGRRDWYLAKDWDVTAEQVFKQEREQAQKNLNTQLVAYRDNFRELGNTATPLATIIRSEGGLEILNEYLDYWNLHLPQSG